MPGLTNQSVAPASTLTEVNKIYDIVNAELTLHETGSTLTADGTEQNLYITETPLGNFKPLVVKVDLDNMQGGDTTRFRTYYRIAQGGAWRQTGYVQYAGADGGLANGITLVEFELLPNRFGVRLTLDQSGGVNRTYLWEVLEES